MKRVALALAVFPMILTACGTMGGGNSTFSDASSVDTGGSVELLEMGLPQSPTPRFRDVPVPFEAKQDLERTYVYETATVQIGRLVYGSKATLAEIAQFYLEECPNLGWELERVVQADGVHAYFKKREKDLTVSITELRGMSRGRRIILNLTPSKV